VQVAAFRCSKEFRAKLGNGLLYKKRGIAIAVFPNFWQIQNHLSLKVQSHEILESYISNFFSFLVPEIFRLSKCFYENSSKFLMIFLKASKVVMKGFPKSISGYMNNFPKTAGVDNILRIFS
jgi:hypothetical protein